MVAKQHRLAHLEIGGALVVKCTIHRVVITAPSQVSLTTLIISLLLYAGAYALDLTPLAESRYNFNQNRSAPCYVIDELYYRFEGY